MIVVSVLLSTELVPGSESSIAAEDEAAAEGESDAVAGSSTDAVDSLLFLTDNKPAWAHMVLLFFGGMTTSSIGLSEKLKLEN